MKIETATQPAPGHNSEDRIFVLPNAVIVLDGVTSRRPPTRNGAWYADQLGNTLTNLLQRQGDLRDLLAEAIETLVTEHDLVPGDSPSSTVAITRWTKDTIEALTLADTPVVAYGTKPHVLQDTRLAELRHKVADVRPWRNRPGGYWVAEADPTAAHQALTTTWQRSEIHTVIMATDGVSCAIDDYALFTWEDLLTKSPEATLEEIRNAERRDGDHKKWPRYKTHDDQALAIIHTA